MNRGPFDPALAELPAEIPIFPLPGVLLLPGANLPLNIFEPRYLNMVADALGAKRIIGMIQPDPVRAGDGDVVVYRVGCAGRITAFNETDDGRFLINLKGVCRFEIAEELETVRGYRRVRTEWRRFVPDLQEVPETCLDRARFRECMSRYFAARSLKVDWAALEQLSDSAIVDFLSMNLPIDPQEKQVLLECDCPARRAEALLAIAHMCACGCAADDGGPQRVRH